MASNPAIATDLAARSLRPLSEVELAWGSTKLDDAWNILVTRLPSLAAKFEEFPPPSLISLVIQVECAMVLRVLGNPNGKLEETIDDYTYRLDQSVSTGALYLSDAEFTLLGSSGGSENAFTIRPAGTTPDQVFVPDWMRSF